MAIILFCLLFFFKVNENLSLQIVLGKLISTTHKFIEGILSFLEFLKLPKF